MFQKIIQQVSIFHEVFETTTCCTFNMVNLYSVVIMILIHATAKLLAYSFLRLAIEGAWDQISFVERAEH